MLIIPALGCSGLKYGGGDKGVLSSGDAADESEEGECCDDEDGPGGPGGGGVRAENTSESRIEALF